jgi:hypothetical protein
MRVDSIEACARSLMELALRRMTGKSAPAKPDDVTVVLYRRVAGRPRRRSR